jgi:HAD superfamily hydrolase (TIGR01549 family)
MERHHWAILLDLDQTLVITSALTELRRQRKWSHIYSLFHLTNLPPGTHHFLQEAHKLASLGIITTSPRSYAERIVAYHQCQIPVVVAYHDTPRQKPFPDPLFIAARKLQLPTTNCFYVGDDLNDISAAVSASAIPIGLCWDDSLKSQDLPSTCSLCKNWDDVLRVITTTMAAKEAIDGLF